MTALFAFAGASLALFGLWELLGAFGPGGRLTQFSSRLQSSLGQVRKEGRAPTTSEYRRLWLVAVLVLFCAGFLLSGLLAGILVALGGPALVAAAVRFHRNRYRDECHQAAGIVARTLADSLGAGNSIRGAITDVVPALSGAAGNEFRWAAQSLALGRPTDVVLNELRARVGSPAWNTLIAAILVAQFVGGNLVALLRDFATAFEATERVTRDARAATAQARFSAWIVLALPVACGGLAEVMSPGFLTHLFSNPISCWFAMLAAMLQAVAWVCVRRVTRSRGL